MLPEMIGWSVVWFLIFFIVYYFDWDGIPWKRRRNIGIIIVSITIALFLPYYIWGAYNLIVFDYYSFVAVTIPLVSLCVVYVITTVVAYYRYYEELEP